MQTSRESRIRKREIAPALLVGALLFCLNAPIIVRAQEARTGLEVCPKLSDRCDSPQKRFAPYELPFRLPKRLKANAAYESVAFYAVVLSRQRDPRCDAGEYTTGVEKFRREAQKLFPDRKVFADHQCPDMGAVAYTVKSGPDARGVVEAFVAVYAGKTEAEARPVLKKARTRFPGAALQRMQVVYSRIVQ
jgi:hypothetical protein